MGARALAAWADLPGGRARPRRPTLSLLGLGRGAPAPPRARHYPSPPSSHGPSGTARRLPRVAWSPPLAGVAPHPTPSFTHSQAARLLAEGKAKYESGDRMGALRIWEQALEKVQPALSSATHTAAQSVTARRSGSEEGAALRRSRRAGRCPPGREPAAAHLPMQGPTKEQRVSALFNATCVHASFGDVELAQITLRGP